MKNFASLLLLSRGVPMLLAGDEIARTQQGNNNAYCQDNEIGWLDWSLADTNADLLSFWQRMIAFRRTHRTLWQPAFYTGAPIDGGTPDLAWYGTRLSEPDWNDPGARTLACTLGGFEGDPDLHVIANMYWAPLDFELPALPGLRWARAVDTSLPAGADITAPGAEPAVDTATYSAPGRSVVVLVSRPTY
jgi:glycogen operon protein